MKKNRERVLTVCLLVTAMWLSGGATVFAVESESLLAAVIPQTGSINALAYTSVGLVLAGLGFMVRKKI